MQQLEAGVYYAPKHRTKGEQERLDKVKAEMLGKAIDYARKTDERRRKDFYLIMELRAQRVLRIN